MGLTTYLEPEFLIRTFGLIGLFFIIFAESGLLIGFFFPGDSLLFTAGFLAPILGINIFVLTIGAMIMAILGDSFGYWFGKKIGPKLFIKEDSLIFKKKHVERSKIFFEKHGAKSLILARFVPIVRTFVPILAGVGEMQYQKFLTFNIIGGLLWGLSFPLLGYSIGRLLPNANKYLTYIILLIIIISFLPIVREYWKQRSKNI